MISDDFRLPPRLQKRNGEIRKAGFEIEFTGLKLDVIARIVTECCGGEKEEITPYHYKIRHTSYGTFGIELDFRFLKEELLRELLEELGLYDESDLQLIRQIESFIATVSETVVPYEITTPPIPMTELEILDRLEAALRTRGARGTDASLFYAFGLHINPEVPDFEVATVVDYLRAFFVLYEWLVYTSKTDFTRRLTTYITPFDDAYVLMVLDPSYRPDWGMFIDDYLRFNPTRNRALDLLPLLSWVDHERVRKVIDDPRVRARPTFHYRLPDSRIDSEPHNLAHAWNRWVEVEKLAENQETLLRMSRQYAEYLADPFSIFEENWALKMEKWLEEK